MKRTFFGFLCILIISQFITSCGSNSSMLSQFSKRKYLKRFKSENILNTSSLIEFESSTNEKVNNNQNIYSSINDNIKIDITEDFDETLSEIVVDTKVDNIYFSPETNNLITTEISKINRTQQPDSTYHIFVDPPQERKVNFHAISSVIGSLLGIPIIPLIWGIIGLSKINKYPEKYSGKGLAITGIILGILILIAGIILIATFAM